MPSSEVILAYKDGHDPAAALMINGEIVAAVEEERFTREKHAPSKFPKLSIDYCLKVLEDYKEEKVTHVIYARRKPIIGAIKVFYYYLTNPLKLFYNFRYSVSHIKVQFIGVSQQLRKKSRYQEIAKIYPSLPKKIYSIDHHKGHAASAFYYSGFDKSLIVTWDGKGEATSIAVWIGANGKIKKKKSWGILSSLGMVYSSITEILGFTPNDGEYKVMGMAALGQPIFDLSDLFLTKNFTGKNNPINNKWITKVSEFLSAKKIVVNDDTKFDIAASFQEYLENICLAIVNYWKNKHKLDYLSIAGGVGLNVKVNQRIWEELSFKDIYVQPAAGDAGLVLGACAILNRRRNVHTLKKLSNVYLGPSYSQEECENAIKYHGLIYKKSENIAKDAAELISANKVIGWHQGRMEFGPRALGNRSVLANPTNPNMQNYVNSRIKFREDFRPFCPSIRSDVIDDIFVKPKIANEMTISFRVKNQIEKIIPAVVHKDNTARPQTVNSKINDLYTELLNELEKQLGLPVVLNTSMNVRGEPMVESPEDAINFFKNTNIDALVISNFIIERTKQNPNFKNMIEENPIKTIY